MKKQQREAQQKQALRQRLEDLASGAYGYYAPLDWHNEEFTGMAGEMGLDAFARWLGAIKVSLLKEHQEWLVSMSDLENFDTINKATEWLWDGGVRA